MGEYEVASAGMGGVAPMGRICVGREWVPAFAGTRRGGISISSRDLGRA